MLEDEGITTTGCPHGRQALICIRRKQPRVLLLDLQMPDVDGITLFLQLRAAPETSTTPVIFVTANAQLLDARLPDYQALGAELLPKPFDMDALISIVERALAA